MEDLLHAATAFHKWRQTSLKVRSAWALYAKARSPDPHCALQNIASCCALLAAQAGFRKQLKEVLEDVEHEERASKEMRRRHDEAATKCVSFVAIEGPHQQGDQGYTTC